MDDNDNLDDLNAFFRRQVYKNGINDYIQEEGTMYLSYELLQTISKAQMQTVERLVMEINNDERIQTMLPKPTEMAEEKEEVVTNEFGTRIKEINKPYCLRKKENQQNPGEGEDKQIMDDMIAGDDTIHLTDIESIYLGIRMKEIAADPSVSKTVLLPDKKIDLEAMTAQVDQFPYDEFAVAEAGLEDGQRLAPQPENSDSVEFNISPYLQQEGKYDLEVGLFGETWAHAEHGNTNALPSPDDILEGLKKFFDDYIDEQMQHLKTSEEIEMFKK